MPAGMAPPREGPPVGAVSPSTPAACSSGGSDHSFYTLGSSGATRHGDGGQASAGRGQSRRRGRGGLRAALLLAALLQALLGAACGAVRQTGQSEIGEPSSTILLAHEQSPYKKYTTRRRPPVESALPSITGSDVFSASARYGSDAQQTYRSGYEMHPFFGPARGGTEVRFVFHDVFPGGITHIYCRFGGQLTEPLSGGYKHALGAMEVMCLAPPGVANTRVKAGISLNGVEYFPGGRGGQSYYYHKDPVVSAVMPPNGDIRGGTRVSFFLAEDYLGNSLGSVPKDRFAEVLTGVRCMFDKVVVPAEPVAMCSPPIDVGHGHGDSGSVPCVVCVSPAASDVGAVQVKLALNTRDWAPKRAPFVYLDFYPVQTTRSGFAIRSLDDELAPNQRFVDEDGQQIDPEDIPALQSLLSSFYGFYGAVDTMTKENPPDYQFYDGMYSFYSTGALGTDRAEVCVTAIKPSTGPAAGNTVVSVRAQGAIPFGHADFYCVFHNTGTIERAITAEYDAAEDAVVLTCAVPPGQAATTEYIGISLDGVSASPLGVPFYFYEAADLSAISPTSGPSHGGTALTATLSNYAPLPAAADSDAVYATCKFAHTSIVGVLTEEEVDGVYTPAAGADFPTVDCTMPGLPVDTVPSGDIIVSVSLNGLDYSGTTLTFTGLRTALEGEQIPLLDLYGLVIDSGALGETMYPEQTLLAAAPLTGPSYMEQPYSLARCLSYPRTSIATLTGLSVTGDLLASDGVNVSQVTVDVAPNFAPGSLAYTAEVPYQMYSGFALAGATTDPYANMFVRGEAVPRDGRSVLTEHDELTGITTAELTVLSSDATSSLTYTVAVRRGAAGTVDTVDDVVITGALTGDTEISPTWSNTTYTGYSARVRFLYSEYLLIEPVMTDPYARAVVTSNETVGSETVGFGQETTAANLTLPVGFSIVTITGVSEGGAISAVSVYDILVERVSAQSVSTLSDMIITSLFPDAGGAVLTPTAWDADVTAYQLNLLFEEEEMTFAPVPTDDVQEVSVSLDGGASTTIPYDTNYTLSSIPLGTSVLTFTSVAEDLSNTTVYNITLVRAIKSTDATLEGILTESCGDSTQGQLSPSFAANVYDYSAVVSHQCSLEAFSDRLLGVRSSEQDITITPLCSDFFCSLISVTFPDGTVATGTNGTSFTIPVPAASSSGVTVDALSSIPIVVTAEDGVTSLTYNLNVTRLARSSLAGLLNFTLDGSYTDAYPTSGVLYQADLTEGFDAEVFSYFMEVEAGVSSLTVTAGNDQEFSVTAVELNPSATETGTGATVMANGTSASFSSLSAGVNNTLRVRVHAEAYQPSQKFEFYSPSAYVDYTVTVFRRTVSTLATLSDISLAVGSLGPIETTTLGTELPLTSNFTSGSYTYAADALFSVVGVTVTPMLPETGSTVSVIDNVNRGTISVGGSTTSSGAASVVQTLAVGITSVNVVVTAEDGVTSRTYELNVTRADPNLDTTLANLVPSSGWLVVAGADGAGGDEAAPSADFAPSTTSYTVRGPHPFAYLTAVLPNSVNSISFAPTANTSVNGVPAVYIQVNGVQVTSGSFSQSIPLADSSFPVPSTAIVEVLVSSEDFSTTTTYTLTVTRAPVQPEPAFWVPFYRLSGGLNESTVDPPASATGAVDIWLTADDRVPATLSINTDLWASTFAAAMPGLVDDYSPVSEVVFQPMYSVDGGAFQTYGEPYTLAANATSKNLELVLFGGTIGELSVKVAAHGLDVEGTLAYGTVHGLMSLANSVMEGPSVMTPGPAQYLLKPYDSYGNRIEDGLRLYSESEFNAFVCPNGTTCDSPGAGQVAQRVDGDFNVFFSMSTNGLNYLHLEASYSFPTTIPSPDLLAGSPVPVTVTGSTIGTRSFVETIPYRSWVVERDPPFFFVHARDDFGNDIFEGGQGDALVVTTDPPLQDSVGEPLEPVVEDVTQSGERGMYRVTLPTTVSGDVAVTVQIDGLFTIQDGAFTLTVLAGDFSPARTPVDYPVNIVAGRMATAAITATDAYGNTLQFDDFSEYIVVKVFQLTGTKRRSLAQSAATRVELPIDVVVTKRDTQYIAEFTAPTDTSVIYGLWVLTLAYPDKEATLPVTPEPVPFTIAPSPATPTDSVYVVPARAAAGDLVLGVRGTDQYGNLSPGGAWRAVAMPVSGSGASVEAGLTSTELPGAAPGTETINLGAAGLTAAGTYSVRLFIGDTEVVTGFPVAVMILPGPVSTLSTVTSPPGQVTIGTTVTLYITAIDIYSNPITTGGEASSIAPYISNVDDPVDTIGATVQDNAGGAYTITFSPNKAGTFTVAINFGGQLRLPTQNFVSITQSTTADDYAVTTDASLRSSDAVYEVNVQQAVSFTVRPQSGVPLDLVTKSVITATLVFVATGAAEELPVVGPTGAGVRSVEFAKAVSGRYALELRVEGQHLLGSPFPLDVVAGAAVAFYVEPLAKIAFDAGEEVDVYVHVLDALGNTVEVDIATEITVAFEQQPGGELVYGEVAADLVTGFAEGSGAGYRGSAALTIAAIYQLSVSLNVGGAVRSLCRADIATDSPNCLPELSVSPAAAWAPASQLTGSGTGTFLVGDSVSLTVYSLDAYDNSVAREYAASELAYTVQIVGPASSPTTTTRELQLIYNPNDNTHTLTYSLTAAGEYSLAVVKAAPRDEAAELLAGSSAPYTVGGAPVPLTVLAGEAVASETSIEDLIGEAVVGRDNALYFTLRDAYGNVVTRDRSAVLKVIINGPATTLTTLGAAGGATLTFSPTGRYTVTYRTAIAGRFTASVFLSDVPSANLAIDVLAGPASVASSAIGSGLFTATAGVPGVFTMLAADTYGNQRRRVADGGVSPFTIAMTVTQRGTGATLSTNTVVVPPRNISVSWSASDGGYRVSYTVGLAGALAISVRVGGAHITSSPFSAQVLAGATIAEQSTVEGLGLAGTVVGRPAGLVIRARDANGNLKSGGGDPFRVSLRCVSPATCGTATPSATITDNGDGTYSASYTPSAAGDYALEVTLRNAHVGVLPARSPFPVTVLAAAGPISFRNTAARGVGLAEARAGQPATFTITAADALGIQLSGGGERFVVELAQFLSGDGVVATGPVKELSARAAGQPDSVVDNLDGSYTVSFTVTAAARHALMVWADATRTTTIAVPPAANGWPVEVTVYPGLTDPAACLLDPTRPLPARAQAGSTITGRVLTYDSFGNRQRYVAGVQSGDEFSVSATARSAPTASGTATRSPDGSGYYDISIVINSLGAYEIGVRLRDPLTGGLMLIGDGTTHPITMLAGGISGRRSLASGAGLAGGLAGADLRVSVLVNDGGGNPVALAGLPTSTCVARLRPEAGSNAGCTMGGPSVGPGTGICDCVNLRCELDAADPARYAINARTTCADTYSLSIALNGSAIASSPFRLPVAPRATNAASSRPSGDALTSAAAGQATTFDITATDTYGNSRTSGGDVFAAWVRHSDGQPDEYAEVVDRGDGRYLATYTPPTVGQHELHVQLNGVPVADSPYALTVSSSATSARATYIIRPPGREGVVAGELAELTVVAISAAGVRQQGGPNDAFEVTLAPASNGFGSVATPIAQRTAPGDATYRVAFTCERMLYDANGEPTPYALSVRLDGEHVKGSPMEIHVIPGPVAARRSELYSGGGGELSADAEDEVGPYGAIAGQRRDLLLQLRDIFGNDAEYDPFGGLPEISMRVTGAPSDPATAEQDVTASVQVIDTQDARFRLSYVAPVAGLYVLAPRVNGAVIGDGAGLGAKVVPGPLHLPSFALTGPGIDAPAGAGIAYYFLVEPRDRYGNFNPDDGRLICFPGNVIYPGVDPALCPPDLLELRMYVRTGGALSGYGRVEVEVAELLFEPKGGSNETGLPWRAGMYRAEFEATVEGELVTELVMGEESLGPFYAPVIAAPVTPATVTLGGAGAQGTALGSGGSPAEPVAVYIEPRDSYGNLAADPAGANVSVTAVFVDPVLGVVDGGLAVTEVVYDPAIGKYVFTFTASQTGSVRLDVLYNGEPIGDGKPIVLPVYEQFGMVDPAFTLVEGPALDGVVVGEETYVNVVLRSTSQLANCFQDAVGEPLASSIKEQRGCKGLPYPYSDGPDLVSAELDFEALSGVVDHGNGTYTVSFTLQTAGNHVLSLHLGPRPDNPQIGSVQVPVGFGSGSFTFLAHPGTTTQADVTFFDITGQSQPAGSLVTYYSGQPLRVVISPQDMFGNLQSYVAAPLDEFRVDVLFNGFQAVPVDYLERRAANSLVAASFFFEAQLTLNITGEYLVDVSFRGESTGGEWIGITTATRVTLVPGLPSPQVTQIAGEGLRVAAAGAPARLRIRLRDASANALGDGLTQRPLVEALLAAGAFQVDTDPIVAPEPAPTTPAPPPLATTPAPPTTGPATPPAGPTATPNADGPTATPGANVPTATPGVDSPTATPGGDAAPTATPAGSGTPTATPMATPTPTVTAGGVKRLRRLAQATDDDGSGVPPVVTAALVGAGGAEVPVSVVFDPVELLYRCEYMTFAAGRYQLDVRLYGRRLLIPDYQYTSVLAGPEHTPSCRVSGSGAGDSGPLPAGELAEFTISAFDANGNALARGGANWDVLLESAIDTDNAADSDLWVPDGLNFVRPSVVTDLRNGRYRMGYRPLVAATYLLSVRRGGVHVAGSPFVVEVRAGPTVPAQSQLTCGGAAEGACGLLDLPAGNQGVFYIQARDRYGGNKTTSEDEFFYSVVGAGGYSKDSLATARGPDFPGQYRATFNTEASGPLSIRVTLRGAPVGMVDTAILPGRVDAQRCTLSSAAFPAAPVWTPGQEPDVVTITARDTYGNSLTSGGLSFDIVMAKTDGTYSVTLSVTDLGDGTYQSAYINKEPGEYRVSGKLGLESLPGRSLTLSAGPPVVAHTEVVSAAGVSGTLGTAFRAGAPAVVWLRFKDVWLNPRADPDTYGALGGASLSVSKAGGVQQLTPAVSFFGPADLDACLAAASSPAALSACETAAGAFRLAFTPTLAGTLRLTFAVDGDVLLNGATGLPFTTVVSPGPASLATSELYGSALAGCVGGARCTLFAKLADTYGNALDRPGLLAAAGQSLGLAFALEGGGAGPAPVAMANVATSGAELPSGVHRLDFTPPGFEAGDYLMRTTVRLVANVPGGALGPDGAGLLGEPLVLVYRINAPLQPSNSGPLDGEGRPVAPGASAGDFPAGGTAVITLQLRDRNGVDFADFTGAGLLAVDLQPAADDLIVVEDGPGVISVRFTPSVAGTYSLSLSDAATGAPLGGGSGQFEVTVAPSFPSSPERSYLEVASDGRLGKAVPSVTATAGVSFTVQVQAVDAFGNRQAYSREVGPEAFKLALRQIPDSPGAEAAPPRPCVVYDNADGTYSAACSATAAGDYDLDAGLRLGGGDGDAGEPTPLGIGIPSDPPVLVTIRHGEVFAPASTLDPPASALAAMSLAAGSPFEFTVQARDTYGNLHDAGGLAFSLQVEVGGDSGWVSVLAEVEASVTPAPGGLYAARLTPARSGLHRISVVEAGSGLGVGQPVVVAVEPGASDASLAEATGGGLAGGVAGSPLRFTLALRDAYGNLVGGQAEQLAMSARRVSGNAGGVELPTLSVLVNETAPGLLVVAYLLPSIGEHDVEVLLGAVRIPGSPFRVVVSPRPPPLITSATFDATLASMTVLFSEPTDRGGARFVAAAAGTSGEGTCDALLPAALLVKLGEAPTCQWGSDTRLRLYFGRGATLLPTERSAAGDAFQLAANRVHNRAGNSYAVVARAGIGLPPADALAAPTATLAGPTTLGVCAQLPLDATASAGGSGRPLRLAFSAAAADGRSGAVVKALAEAVGAAGGGSPGFVAVPSAALDPGRAYTFRLEASNYLGVSSTAALSVLKSNLPLPGVSILGAASRLVRRSADTVVSAAASPPDLSCLPNAGGLGGTRIAFSWEQVDGPELVETNFPSAAAWDRYSASLTTRYLVLPAGALGIAMRPDGSLLSYTFRLTASMEADPVLAASAEVELAVEPDPIAAAIQGGSGLSLPRGAPLQLDIATDDPSAAVDTEGNPTPFIFLWTCATAADLPCFPATSPANSLLNTAQERLALPSGMLTPGEYVFGVTVTREPLSPSRTVTSSVTVAVGAGVGALSTSLNTPGGLVIVTPGGPVDPDEPEEGPDEATWVLGIASPLAAEVSPARRLVLQGIITPPAGGQAAEEGEELEAPTLAWSCVEGDLVVPGTLAAAADSALDANYLSLPPGALTPGSTYRFRLTGGGAAAGAVAEAAVAVSAAPWGGSLEVATVVIGAGEQPVGDAPAGTELVTRFMLRARDWAGTDGVVDFAYVPNVRELLTAAGLDPNDWATAAAAHLPLLTDAERYLGRTPAGSVALEAILPEGSHMVIAYVLSPDGAAARAVFPQLFQLGPPPTLRRRLLQSEQLLATQARRAVNLGLTPALAVGDVSIASQFLDVYAGRYGGNAPLDPLGTCSLSALEGVTVEVAEAAIELAAVGLRHEARSSQDVCVLAALLADPTAVDISTASAGLDMLTGLLGGGEALSLRGLRCGAGLISAVIVNAATGCGAGGGQRDQALLDASRAAVAALASAAGAELRAGMAPVLFDTGQLTLAVAAHPEAAAAGSVVSTAGARPGVPPSASFDVAFAASATDDAAGDAASSMALGPSPLTPTREVRSVLMFTATVSLLPPEAASDRLASLPASLTLSAITINPSIPAIGPAELPAVATSRLTRAPVIRPTDGFSPTLYAWRGADWAPLGGSALLEGDAAWGVQLGAEDAPLPLGLEPQAPNSLTFAVWLRDPLSPPVPSPPPPQPSPPPPVPPVIPVAPPPAVPSWVYWAVPIVAVCLLLMIIGLVLICRRRLRARRLQTLHPTADNGTKGKGPALYKPPANTAASREEKGKGPAPPEPDSPGSASPAPSSFSGSESKALMAPGTSAALATSLSGAEQAARAAEHAPSFGRQVLREDDTDSEAGTDIGSSDDEMAPEEAGTYTVHDPFRNAPAARTLHAAQPAVPVPAGHFQTIGGGSPGGAVGQRAPLFDSRRPGRQTAADRMRSGALAPGQAPRAAASLNVMDDDRGTISREHWTGRGGGPRRPGDGGKY